MDEAVRFTLIRGALRFEFASTLRTIVATTSGPLIADYASHSAPPVFNLVFTAPSPPTTEVVSGTSCIKHMSPES
jgi:hypothetical protein